MIKSKNKKRKKKVKENKRINIGLIITAAITLLCTAIYIYSYFSSDFAEFFTVNIASYFRLCLGAASSICPIALSEILVIAFALLALFAVGALIVFFFKVILGVQSRRFPRTFKAAVLILVYVWNIFTLTFASSYNRYSLNDHLGLDGELTEEKVFGALNWFVAGLNESAAKIKYNVDGMSTSERNFTEASVRVTEAVNELCEKYGFLQSKGFRPKPVLLSEPMTYTHISGIYTFFTGESVVNVNYPEYIYTFTTAHESSHQRGIAYENEANVTAFMICMESDDDYIRYSGLAYMYPYIANAAYKTNPERYKESIRSLDVRILGEYDAYDEFFKKYEENLFEKVASKVNDTYLKSQGQKEGVVTYSLVTTMVINYFDKYLKNGQ